MKWNKVPLVALLILSCAAVLPQAVAAVDNPRLSLPPSSELYDPEPGWKQKIALPSPMEIRRFEPKPSNLMWVRYANDRVYLFEIKSIKPRSECNGIQYDFEKEEIKIITQAVSNAYEYVLGKPLMVAEWQMVDP
tara:strand:+ start:1332 stop:1736 length:405 start_codon:yes stop_codon:yes gene_type:complete